MPRPNLARSSAYAPRSIGLDDKLPNSFFDGFLSIDSGEGKDATSEPALKRRKLDDPSSVHAIRLADGQLTFSRPCEDDSTSATVVMADIERDLKLWLGNHGNGDLFIQARNRSQGPSWADARVTIDPQNIDSSTRTILSCPGFRGNVSKKGAPGAIWRTIDLRIERKGREATFTFSTTLFWNENRTPSGHLRAKRDRNDSQMLIDTFLPRPAGHRSIATESPMDFYEAAFVPPKDDSESHTIEVPALEATLFPYQKRTLKWLLGREGVSWSSSSKRVEPSHEHLEISGPQQFRTVRTARGQVLHLSDTFHTITTDISAWQNADYAVKGGILAEEMGLGKTLEILGLISLHKRLLADDHAERVQDGLLLSGATLIVAPEPLRAQWISEITRHAPFLRVKHYEGCKRMEDESEQEVVKELAGYDVVITTYLVLSAELHFAFEPPERSRRYERVYRRPKSPLVQISWWRLCLDEAQMIENGYGQAAMVARAIPRINAWGITGTPVKEGVKDLYGLLLFLRYEPYCTSPWVWEPLLQGNKPLFQKIFNSLALRHTKALVRDEITLPPQKRYVISMPFTAVEEQHYQSLFKEMTEECQLDDGGGPLTDTWDPTHYEEPMRVWLNRLRQTALHPEVGVYSRRALGQSKSRPMRTVDEVLDAMLEQTENVIRTEQRAHLQWRLTRGQLFENSPRVKEAQQLWEDVKKETSRLVVEAKEALQQALLEEGKTKSVEDLLDDAASDASDTDDDADDIKGKGKIGDCARRLRSMLDLDHRATFFCANAYFQIRDNPEMTEPDSTEFERLKRLENEGYDEAKALRREILQQPNRRAGRLMSSISRKASVQSFAEIPELSIKAQKGIESGRLVEKLEQLYSELNEQANVLDDWREQVIQLLLRPLVDEEDDVETTGEELGESAKAQDELMVYVQALRAAVADRQEAISGQVNELVKHEAETSLRFAKNDEGPAPQKLMELLKMRQELKPGEGKVSLRGMVSEFRQLQYKLPETNREQLEHGIATHHLKDTQAAMNEQNKAALALEAEIEIFTRAMNSRLEFYRQLQAVSDSVLQYEGPRTDDAVRRMETLENEARRKLGAAEAKHRYLMNLKEAGAKSSEPRMCVICQVPFMTGVLTVCGHQFCKDCMMMWFKSHHNCPVCKKALKASNLHDITIKPQQLKVHTEDAGQRSQEQEQQHSPTQGRNSAARKTMIYSDFNADKLAEITSIELEGPSFTTKVDTLVRHLLWLRQSDPGAKSIVFSQYNDFLKVLRNAFRRFRIGYSSIDERDGITKFKGDPGIECFLLHARAHSNGLNLVNANHVFLCEPLLNTAIELQAIARVDRIGQQHETTVWLYYVAGTVEESIYNLSVRRRMEHMGRNVNINGKGKSKESTPELLDASIEAANTLELEQAALSKLMSKDRTAGEIVDKGDLWECLFGHLAQAAAEGRDVGRKERDPRLQERAVMSYLADEAAKERRQAE